MRLVEIRLLEGPNLYALEPVVKVEVAIGRGGAPSKHEADGGSGRRLGDRIPSSAWPAEVAALVAWSRRLQREAGEGRGAVAVHRAAEPGRWVVTFAWTGSERARAIAEGAATLAARGVPSGPGTALTPAQRRLVGMRLAAIRRAAATPPAWVRDADRRMPVVSISGTNGKSTVTRLVTHILVMAGRHVGTTTSDGVYVDERLIEAGDWTGPGGAARVLERADVDIGVLETARGGILLRGVGYESNDVSVVTNISADHLDLQGIHTLEQLAEVKATICRITRPSGRVVLNADDPLVRSVARRVRARVALFTLAPGSSGPVRRHLARGGVAYALRDGAIVELQGPDARPILEVADLPIAFSGMARHNVANALAAAAAARGLGTSLEAVAAGLRDFRPTSELSPGRLNVFRLGETLVIVDFAHNEAGVEAVLDVAAGLAAIGTGQAARITAIVGMAGDRPDEALRAVGRVAARRASRVAIKETLRYLRGRARESAVDELLSGMTEGGADRAAVPVYGSETEALAAELDLLERGSLGPGDGARTVMVLLCHEDREGVFALLHRRGAEPLEDLGEAAAAAPPGAAVPA